MVFRAAIIVVSLFSFVLVDGQPNYCSGMKQTLMRSNDKRAPPAASTKTFNGRNPELF
jgi:hypothetical protein